YVKPIRNKTCPLHGPQVIDCDWLGKTCVHFQSALAHLYSNCCEVNPTTHFLPVAQASSSDGDDVKTTKNAPGLERTPFPARSTLRAAPVVSTRVPHGRPLLLLSCGRISSEVHRALMYIVYFSSRCFVDGERGARQTGMQEKRIAVVARSG
ncbi:hypothetical protein IscW_ISCW005949, partial [Ixodes scapularis]